MTTVSTTTPAITADFEADWIEILRNQLIAAGYPAASKSARDVELEYFNVRSRQIDARPRKVAVSREFTCPAAVQAGLNLVRQKAEQGQDLGPRQSTSMKKASYNDMLFNHWGLHHIHLGTTLMPGGAFVTRTGPVLFARVTPDTFYMIDVLDHGSAKSKFVWASLHLVEVIHRNWPDTIARYKVEGQAETTLDEKDISALRAGGVCPVVTLTDGTVYMPFRGYATSGDAIEVVMVADRYMRTVRGFERTVREQLPQLIAEAATRGVEMKPPFHFRLDVDANGKARAVEVNSKVAFGLGQI